MSEPSVIEQIRPTAQMVADLVRTRLIEEAGHMDDGSGGTEVDTFTADTYPSLIQAERMIDQAVLGMVGQLPGSIIETNFEAATHLSALYAAILIEGSYFREQLTDDQVQLYWELLKSGIRGVQTAGDSSSSGLGGGGHVDSVVTRGVYYDPLATVVTP